MRTFSKDLRDALAQVALNKVLAEPEKEFGYRHIAAENHIHMDTAEKLVRGWVREGIVVAVTDGKGSSHKSFKVRPDYRPVQPPAGRSAVMNLWSTMRGLKTFSAVDLAAHSTTETVSVSPEGARTYASSLLQAGYLRVERKAVPGKHDAIYRLIKNTGPIPPMLRRVEAVVDLNTGATIVIGGGA